MLKEVLIRILIYPFCMFLFYWFWQMTFEDRYYPEELYNFRAKIYGPIGLIFSTIYPVTDILIGIKKLLKKNDNPK